MAINVMNQLFARHGKWFFGIFTVIIIITFVGFFTPGGFGVVTSDGGNVGIGAAYGEEVTYNDAYDELSYINYFYQLHGNGPINYSNEMLDQAFAHLCYLKAAENRGIEVSTRQIADEIVRIPQFQTDGKFDRAKFDQFLVDKNISGKDCDEAIRRMLMVQQLENEIISDVIITDNEVEQYAKLLGASYNFRVMNFNAADYSEVVTDEALTDFFAQAQSSTPEGIYRIPAEFEALVVEIPFSEEDKEAKTSQAYAFADGAFERIADAHGDKEKIFTDLAAQYKYVIKETGKINAAEGKAGTIPSAKLAECIANVDRDVPVTEVLEDNNVLYIAYVRVLSESRPAEIGEVKKQVITDFLQWGARRLAGEAAEKYALDLQALPEAERNNAVLNDPKFQSKDAVNRLSTQPASFADMMLLQAGMQLPLHGVSGPVPTQDGFILIYLESMTIPETLEDTTVETARQLYTRNKAQTALMNFQYELDANCGRYNLEEIN